MKRPNLLLLFFEIKFPLVKDFSYNEGIGLIFTRIFYQFIVYF